jgi:hypothetical protein
MTEKIVLTLSKHPIWDYILQPVLVEENEYGKLAILENADSKSSGFSQLNDLSKEIILLSENIADTALMEKFSKEKERTVAVFHRKVKSEIINDTIRPYIEDIQHQILLLLKDSELPLYIRENVKIRNLYDTNLTENPDNHSKVIFEFRKKEDTGIHYSIRIKWQEEEMDLFSKPYFLLCSDPASLVIDKKVLLFDDVDIKKLKPFFSKQEIEIPLSYESTYIKTFIRNCLENNDVIVEGIDIKEIIPAKKAILSFDTDTNNRPVLKLILNYEKNEYPLDTNSKKMVQAVENAGKTSLTWFQPDKVWEKSLIGKLLKGGMEQIGPQHFSLKKNKAEILIDKQMENMIDWISLHKELTKHFEFDQTMLK